VRKTTWAVAAAAAGVLLATAAAGTANALGGNPDMLPAGSLACTDWVQSSQGAYLRGFADYNPATFTTRMASTPGGPETTIFTSVTHDIPYNVLVTMPGGGTQYLRNCVEATSGPVYRYSIRIQGAGAGRSDVGPHQALLGPGGRHCGDYVEGPTVGLDDGVTRLTASSNIPVRFYLTATNEDYAFVGAVLGVTGTSIDQVYVPPANFSSISACAENTSSTTATVSFEISAV
jgi:hypothetical protein